MSLSHSKNGSADADSWEIKLPTYDANESSNTSLDDAQLRRLGYQPRLSRNFGLMSMLGLSCSVVMSWESGLANTVSALMNGGPAGMIYSFLVSWVGMVSVYSVLGELASAAPTAGGQYYWVAWIAPKRYRKFLAYETAWLTNLAWQASFVSTTYVLATMVQGIAKLNSPSSYQAENWHTMLIQWAFAILAILINCTTGHTLALLEGAVLILHLAGFFAILIPLVYLSPHNSASSVFTTFINEGGWSTQTLSFFVGFPVISTTLCSADCAVHMSEEIQGAAVVVPRALLYGVMLDGILTFGMILGMLFCIVDLESALQAKEVIFYPYLEVFRVGVNSAHGAAAMGSIIVVLGTASAVGIVASASRLMWSFARDRGLPGDKYLVKIPIATILVTLVICMVLSLLDLGLTVVLGNILSVIVSALYSSYLLAAGLLLWRRCAGGSSLPEPLGTLNNVFACLYCALLLFWSFWPGEPNPSLKAANWSPLVYAGVVVFSLVWYVWRARHYFQGPMI
ncbi:amino acid/polyamine transporter I [Cercophora scortea]|uniref:Amino acid/polyamine transporter I n=1 Tax=Cercophora scortea TaxID=314031 RepID=A0AAE0IUU9_9PEZI|nr:amino acid/polyamine transporter I [Cercophora scortea]